MNIIYFNPDEMRADVLGCYGHKLVKTPNIDKFASKAVRFEQCHVQHPVCSPSRCSFTTGWYPHTAGHRSLWNLLHNDEPNTLKYLKNNGYQVHYMGKNDLLAPDAVEDSITHLYDIKEGAGPTIIPFAKDEAGYMSFLGEPAVKHVNDYHIVKRAIEFLKSPQAKERPFMLFLASAYPHCPYRAPEPWHSMYSTDDIPDLIVEDLKDKPMFRRLIRQYRCLDEMKHEDMKKIMAVYLGMVSYVDYLFGLLLECMDQENLWENTSLFFFSDHGDWAGDYNLVEKWPSALDDAITRVPMIVYTPDCKSGHIVQEQIECFDIMPTTLELTNTPVRHTHNAISMIPQLSGESGDPNRAVFAEGGYDEVYDYHCFEGIPDDDLLKDPYSIYYPKAKQQIDEPKSACRAVMIRTPKYKLIRRSLDIHELYDLENDPKELHNCYGQLKYAEIQQELQERLLDWYLKTSDVTPWVRDPRRFVSEHKITN